MVWNIAAGIIIGAAIIGVTTGGLSLLADRSIANDDWPKIVGGLLMTGGIVLAAWVLTRATYY